MADPAPIPFEAFMQRALHDPEQGYYSRRIRGVGQRGDFTTAPELSDCLARTIATWAADALSQSGCRDLIEIGPGSGRLARQVWKFLPWSLRLRCRLHLVETSGPLRELQQQTLPRQVRWHSSAAGALEACRGRAVIYSNELVDAFAVRRYQLAADGWREIAVSFDQQGRASESLLPLAPLPASTSFTQHHPTGQRIEVHETYHHWLASWMPHWQAGRLLTIDYGDEAATLYHRRPHGTLRAYLLQHRLEGPAIYDNIGRQDLTADVNFSDLIEWSAAWTSDHRLMSFAEFLGSASGGVDERLTDAQGAGGAFKVLVQDAGRN